MLHWKRGDEADMQNVVQYPIRPGGSEKKKRLDKVTDIQLLYRPEIVARDGRYVAYVNRVICDCFSGLEWLPGPDRDISWDEGHQWVRGLSTGGGGWRLPSLSELRGLFQKNKNGDNLSPLFEISTTDVWSGEIYDEASAWGFNFLPGNQFRTCKTFSRRFRVLAVRPRKYYAYEKKTKARAD
jgi:hypothetical protein